MRPKNGGKSPCPSPPQQEGLSSRGEKGKKSKGFVTPTETNFHWDALCFMVKTWGHNTTETVLKDGWRLAAVGVWRRIAVAVLNKKKWGFFRTALPARHRPYQHRSFTEECFIGSGEAHGPRNGPRRTTSVAEADAATNRPHPPAFHGGPHARALHKKKTEQGLFSGRHTKSPSKKVTNGGRPKQSPKRCDAVRQWYALPPRCVFTPDNICICDSSCIRTPVGGLR